MSNGKSKLGQIFFYSDLKFTAIHSFTLYNVCVVPWGCSVPWGVQYCGVYLEYRGGVQYCGRYLEYRGGYLEYRGVFSTVGDIMLHVGIS